MSKEKTLKLEKLHARSLYGLQDFALRASKTDDIWLETKQLLAGVVFKRFQELKKHKIEKSDKKAI